MKERFPDKRRPEINFKDTTAEIRRQTEYSQKVEIAQEEATWHCYGEYPELPVAVVYMTDIHYGAKGVDYDMLEQHLETIKNTPNMFLLVGGDVIDAFSPTKHSTGMSEDVIGPDEQAEAMMDMLSEMDRLGKLGGVQIGNHDDWSLLAGYRFERFLSELQCPVFSGAGNINIMVGDGGETYRTYWSHSHWGVSKLNITNAAKRAMQFSSPDAEIALLGHVHQGSVEHFDIAGEDKIAVIGGTYKQKDGWASKWGMTAPGKPGFTLFLWPNEHRKEVFRTPEFARDTIINAIRNKEEDGYEDPYTEMIRRLNLLREQTYLREEREANERKTD